MTPEFKKRLLLLSGVSIAILLLTYPLNRLYETYRVRALIESTPAEIVSSMTLDEKIGQIVHVGMEGTLPTQTTIEDIERFHVGGVILFAANLGTDEDIARLNGSLQDLSIASSGVPLFISIDQEGGRVVRVKSASAPSALGIGQVHDKGIAYDIGFVTSYKMRKLGFNMLLAPVLDVNNNPDNPVINTRSFGTDPQIVAEMGVALAGGIRAAGSVSVIKHFPGHGDTNMDSHLALPRIDRSLAQLERVELIPFRRAIEKGAEAVMSAHIIFRELDPNNPATLSPKIIRQLLRQDLNFDGLVMTDAMEMHAIAKNYTYEEASKMAFRAGADIILLTSSGKITRDIISGFKRAFESGELSIQDLDRAVLRQIRLKCRYGLFPGAGSARYSLHPILSAHFDRNEKKREQTYQNILNHYVKGGPALEGSVRAIRSLGRYFAGFSPESKSGVHVVYRSKILHDAAVQNGFPENRIHRFTSLKEIIRFLSGKEIGESWIVEFDEQSIPEWNRLVSSPETKDRFTEHAPLIGIYSGNPFLKIDVPENGAVLLTFSPDDESLRAALVRGMDGQPIQMADLPTRSRDASSQPR
jgi:beta-N-acetylhexosaminidase